MRNEQIEELNPQNRKQLKTSLKRLKTDETTLNWLIDNSISTETIEKALNEIKRLEAIEKVNNKYKTQN